MQVPPYLQFDGRCEEAIEFYKGALGAEVEQLMPLKDSPDPAKVPPGSNDKVLHSCFRVGNTRIMASDGDAKRMIYRGFKVLAEA
jgi:PhnB protein